MARSFLSSSLARDPPITLGRTRGIRSAEANLHVRRRIFSSSICGTIRDGTSMTPECGSVEPNSDNETVAPAVARRPSGSMTSLTEGGGSDCGGVNTAEQWVQENDGGRRRCAGLRSGRRLGDIRAPSRRGTPPGAGTLVSGDRNWLQVSGEPDQHGLAGGIPWEWLRQPSHHVDSARTSRGERLGTRKHQPPVRSSQFLEIDPSASKLTAERNPGLRRDLARRGSRWRVTVSRAAVGGRRGGPYRRWAQPKPAAVGRRGGKTPHLVRSLSSTERHIAASAKTKHCSEDGEARRRRSAKTAKRERLDTTSAFPSPRSAPHHQSG